MVLWVIGVEPLGELSQIYRRAARTPGRVELLRQILRSLRSSQRAVGASRAHSGARVSWVSRTVTGTFWRLPASSVAGAQQTRAIVVLPLWRISLAVDFSRPHFRTAPLPTPLGRNHWWSPFLFQESKSGSPSLAVLILALRVDITSSDSSCKPRALAPKVQGVRDNQVQRTRRGVVEVLRLAAAGDPSGKLNQRPTKHMIECRVLTNLDIEELEFGAG